MGTSLTGKNISSSYLGLLKTTDSAVIGSTAKRLTDGNGTDSPLFLSTSQLGIGVTPTEALTISSGNIQLSNDNKLQFGTSDVFIKGTTATDNIQIGLQGATKLTLHQTNGLTLAQYGSGSITGTVTQRLGVTSSGQVVEIPIGSGAVDGSGTAGKITKWSDSDTITDSIMSESSSTIEIGASTPILKFNNLAGGGLDPSLTASGTNFTISTSSLTPLSIALDTADSTFAGNILFSSDATISRNTSDASDNGQIKIGGGGDASDTRGASVHLAGNEHANTGILQLRVGNVSGGTIRLYTGGGEKARLDSSGRLLINRTSSNGDILEVDGNANVYSARFNGNATTGQSYGLRVRAGTNSSDKSMLVENTSGTDLFAIKGDGNAIFDGDVNINSSTGAILTLTDTDTTIGVDSIIGHIAFVGTEISSETSRIASVSETAGGEGGLRFYTGASVTQALQLDISQNATFTGQVIASSSSSGDYVRMYGGSGTGKWDIYGSGTDLRFTDNESAGLVRFDTIVQTDKIFVAKGQNVAHGASQLRISQESTSLSELRFYGADASTVGSLRFIGSSSDGSAGGERMRIKSTGAITTNADSGLPLQLTSVVSGGSELRMRQSRGSIASPSNSSANGDGNYLTSYIYASSAYSSIGHIGIITGSTTDNGHIQFSTATSGTVTEKMRLNDSGQLGIGTVSPSTQIHLYSSAPAIRLQDSGNWGTNATGFIQFYDQNSLMVETGVETSGDYIMNLTEVGNIKLSTDNTERMRIDSSGNIQFTGSTSNTTVLSLNTSDGSDTKQLSLVGGGADSDGRGARMRLYGNEHTSSGVVDLSTGNITGSFMLLTATDNIQFSSGGSEKMRLDSSGRLAIGSTSADAKLDISQSSATEPVLRLTDSGVANYDYIFPDSNTIKLETNTSSDKTFKLLNAGSGNFNFETSDALMFGGLTVYGNSTIGDNFADAHIINGSFRQIRSTNTSTVAVLDVTRGDANNEGANATDFRFVASNRALTTERANMELYTNDDQAVDMGAGIGFGGRHTDSSTNDSLFNINSNDKKAGKENSTSANYAGYLSFGRLDTKSDSDIVERMRITSGGTISIPSGDRDNGGKGGALIVGGNVDSTGTTTNTRKIGIISSPSHDNTDGNVIMMANDSFDSINHNLYLGSIYTGYTSPKNIVFITADAVGGAGSEAMRIMGDGDIGIGTSSPANKVHIYGVDGTSYLRFTSDVATTGSRIGLNSDDLIIENQQASGDMIFDTNSTERMRLDSSGRLGIGESSINAPLHVVNETTSDNGKFQRWAYSSGSSAYVLDLKQTVTSDVVRYNFSMRNNGTAYDDVLVLDRGNVGLGNVTPPQKLTISSGHLRLDDTYKIEWGGTNARIDGSNSSDYLRFFTTDTERMRVLSGGQVCIGTTSTTVSSSVVSAVFGSGSDATLKLGGHSGTHTMIQFLHTGTVVGSVSSTTVATTYNTSSDYRLKEDLQDFNALDIASKIKMYDFKWKADDSRSYGVMAHELEEVLPQAVTGEKDGEEMQSVDYSKLVPILLKSIQELKAEIDELKKINSIFV